MQTHIRNIQKEEDQREDREDQTQLLRIFSNVAPNFLKQNLLPFGNVHASVCFGPLVFEIGAKECVI